MEGVEVEFEMDDRNILLVRYDDLPLADEPLDVLAISHKELLALFETAAKLPAGRVQSRRPNARLRGPRL